jgi:hypothetical protein
MTDLEFAEALLAEVVAAVGCTHKAGVRVLDGKVVFTHFIRKGRHQYAGLQLDGMKDDRDFTLRHLTEQFRLSCVSEETEASLAFKQGYHYGFEDASQPYRNLMSNVERGLLKIVETE